MNEKDRNKQSFEHEGTMVTVSVTATVPVLGFREVVYVVVDVIVVIDG